MLAHYRQAALADPSQLTELLRAGFGTRLPKTEPMWRTPDTHGPRLHGVLGPEVNVSFACAAIPSTRTSPGRHQPPGRSDRRAAAIDSPPAA